MRAGRARVNKFVKDHELPWETAMATLTLVYVIVAFADDRSTGAASLITTISVTTIALSVVFLAEFAVRLWASQSRVAYLRGHWLDLVTCIPAVGPLRLLRLLRLVGLIRFVTRARKTLVLGARRKKADALMGPWLVGPTLVLLWFGSASGFWFLERGLNPHVTNFGDALFLSFITATTVGNSTLQPVTPEGQILAGLVIFVGLGLLGFVSARLTARWLNQENDAALTSAEVKSLRSELSEIKELLNRSLELSESLGMQPIDDIVVVAESTYV
jgi:voltage-gated potassium channel